MCQKFKFNISFKNAILFYNINTDFITSII